MNRKQLAEVTRGSGVFQRGNDKHDTIRVISIAEGNTTKVTYAAKSCLNAQETINTLWIGALLDKLIDEGYRTHWTTYG